ncbi:MAG: phage terminase large subunit family protein, partial [Planctomycetota bacterium]|nr:phage terminase large subunit family protein [Planctomycetota bacterium]
MISPYIQGFFETFRPRPRLDVSDWTERYRILPKDGASAPGPWRNDRTPYLVEIMDTLSVSSPATEVVFVKGSQIGATEAALNWILYLIDYVGGPILALQPTDDNASEWSKQRIAPSMELCERIKGKLRPAKSRDSDNTILEKGFLGGRLFLSGVNSPNALASKPIGNIYGDEIDRWPGNVGGNGDPVEQVKRRMATYKRGKRFLTSSPVLLSDSRIWPKYLDSDQRVYEVPCPHCGHYQEITFDKLVWSREDPDAVHMACEQCAGVIEEYHKTEMLESGKWRAKNPGHWRIGFHLSALYSPLGWLSWAEAVRTFIEAEGDVVKMQVFVNTILGLPWAEDSESIAEDYLKRRAETYKAQAPMGVLVLTMAVDVQSNRLEYEIVGWGEGEESWGIEYGVLRGDPTELKSGDPDNPSVWERLDD